MDLDERLNLLWIGFRTLRSLEEGCLGRKRVSVRTVRSFEDGTRELAERSADIVVLSISASGQRLRKQIERTRALAPGALIAVVVCNETDAQFARDVGADDVMALEREGELVCAPVLRWVEMRRRGNNGLIDLQAATRRRRGLEAEISTLHAEVQSLSRQAVRDPASGALGREAFVLQLELACRLLGRRAERMHLFVYELTELGEHHEDWGDFVLGGVSTRVAQMLSEVGGEHSIIGRLAPSRFAIALTDMSKDDAEWLASVASSRLGEIEVPSGRLPRVLVAGGQLGRRDRARPGTRLLEELETALAGDADMTRVMRRA